MLMVIWRFWKKWRNGTFGAGGGDLSLLRRPDGEEDACYCCLVWLFSLYLFLLLLGTVFSMLPWTFSYLLLHCDSCYCCFRCILLTPYDERFWRLGVALDKLLLERLFWLAFLLTLLLLLFWFLYALWNWFMMNSEV